MIVVNNIVLLLWYIFRVFLGRGFFVVLIVILLIGVFWNLNSRLNCLLIIFKIFIVIVIILGLMLLLGSRVMR